MNKEHRISKESLHFVISCSVFVIQYSIIPLADGGINLSYMNFHFLKVHRRRRLFVRRTPPHHSIIPAFHHSSCERSEPKSIKNHLKGERKRNRTGYVNRKLHGGLETNPDESQG